MHSDQRSGLHCQGRGGGAGSAARGVGYAGKGTGRNVKGQVKGQVKAVFNATWYIYIHICIIQVEIVYQRDEFRGSSSGDESSRARTLTSSVQRQVVSISDVRLAALLGDPGKRREYVLLLLVPVIYILLLLLSIYCHN